MYKSFSHKFLQETISICNRLDKSKIESVALLISNIKKKNGRIFFLGVGGSAGNSSHAVNDFRKLANIECYTPIDNASELTARINDDGWNNSFSNWLKVSKLILGRKDGYLAKNSNEAIIIPDVNKNHITPHSEAFQGIIWHLLITHPMIKKYKTKW